MTLEVLPFVTTVLYAEAATSPWAGSHSDCIFPMKLYQGCCQQQPHRHYTDLSGQFFMESVRAAKASVAVKREG